MDHVVVWLVFSFAVSPGTWPGGAWVPGGPRPCFLLLLLVHDPNFVFRNFHQDVSRFTVHKGLRPNSRIMYRFFTSHQPMLNEQDQVTWTNWPASKKKSEGFQRGLKPSLVLFVSTSVFGRACEKGIVMLPRGVSERVADNLFGCRAFSRRRHLEGM